MIILTHNPVFHRTIQTDICWCLDICMCVGFKDCSLSFMVTEISHI